MRWRRPSGAAARMSGCTSAWIACRRTRSTPRRRSRALPPLIKGYLRLGRVCRRRRGHRPAVRHHRRADHPARREDRSALFRALRHAERSEEPRRRRRLRSDSFALRVALGGPVAGGRRVDRGKAQRALLDGALDAAGAHGRAEIEPLRLVVARRRARRRGWPPSRRPPQPSACSARVRDRPPT